MQIKEVKVPAASLASFSYPASAANPASASSSSSAAAAAAAAASAALSAGGPGGGGSGMLLMEQRVSQKDAKNIFEHTQKLEAEYRHLISGAACFF